MNPPIGCPIPNANGWAKPTGPIDAPLCFVGEAAGSVEVVKSAAFQGPAGDELNRWIKNGGMEREDVRVGNVVVCQPPRDYLVGAPWEDRALEHCRPQLDALLAEPHKAWVGLGGTALRSLLDLPRGRATKEAEGGVRVQDFHGSPVRHRDKLGVERWIVPTFHPAYILRGQWRLRKTVAFDLTVAAEVAAGTWVPDYPELVENPPLPWFEAWVDRALASECWLAADIETPDKERKSDEGELGKEDKSYQILCINLSCSTGEGITVPWEGAYISEVRRLLEKHPFLVFWNAVYDVPRLIKAGIHIDWARVWDFMDAWHVLHSASPRGLGFVAPFYSRAYPWKHLGNRSGVYRAMDGVQTLRCAFGIATDLRGAGMWDIFERHCKKLDEIVLRPAEDAGLLLDRGELTKLDGVLAGEAEKARQAVLAMVPQDLWPLDGPYARRPDVGEAGFGADKEGNRFDVVVKVERSETIVCGTCGSQQVPLRHRCKDAAGKVARDLVPAVRKEFVDLDRFYKRFDFNPGSWEQVLGYILWRKHSPGRNRKTGKDSTDKKTLERLQKTGDPFYSTVLLHRQATKMRGTYSAGILDKLDAGDRVHGTFTHTPSTMRLASKEPNLQNLAHHVRWANDFRRCIVAAPGCVLLSADFAGIEAVITGWCMGDPVYIDLAKKGMHAFVTSHLLVREGKLSEPIDRLWPIERILAAVNAIKAEFYPDYDKCKHVVHGYNYGLTAFGLMQLYPEVFPTAKSAQALIDIYETVCPELPKWHKRMRQRAHEQGYLGGPGPYPVGHPFSYRHEFYGVINYKKLAGKWKEYLGEDAKRCVAFYPQSTAGGVLYEAALRLMDPDERSAGYIGDAFYGRSPIRALIHDELFLEVEEAREAEVREKLAREMTRPVPQLPCPAEWGIGKYLQIGVSIKRGKNWGPLDPKRIWSQDGNPDGMAEVSEGIEGIAADVWREVEEEDEDAA